MTDVVVFLDEREILFFSRNKDLKLLLSILAGDRERVIFLNERHNVIELSYFTGSYTRNNKYEVMGIESFGASYEVLDALFDKYKNDRNIRMLLTKFCLRSKCKSYWDVRLKHSDLATEIMASVLGGKE